LKQKIKERVFQSEEQILATLTESWNELTFEDIQEVSIIGWNAQYGWLPTAANTTNHKWLGLPLTLLDQEIARRAQDFFAAYISPSDL
jgi:hypothetical protein